MTLLTDIATIGSILESIIQANIPKDTSKPVLPHEIEIAADVATVFFPAIGPVVQILEMLASTGIGQQITEEGMNLLKKIAAAEINDKFGTSEWGEAMNDKDNPNSIFYGSVR